MTVEEMEKEIKRLKIQVEILTNRLMTTHDLPVLGPGRWEDYKKALDREMVKANL